MVFSESSKIIELSSSNRFNEIQPESTWEIKKKEKVFALEAIFRNKKITKK